jgi:hypothetical protein
MGKLDIFNSRLLEAIGGDLPKNLKELFEQSKPLWASILEMNPAQVEAMSESQKVLKLIENKTQVYENCINILFSNNEVDTNYLNQESKNRILARVVKISELMKRRDVQLEKTTSLTTKLRNQKNDILQIFEAEGDSSKKAAIKLLQITCDKNLNEVVPESPREYILLEMLKDYQTTYIQHAVEKKTLDQISTEIFQTKETIQKHFENVIEQYEDQNKANLQKRQDVLNAYVTFSFVIFNEDIFPSVSMKKESKKLAVSKMKSIQEKLLKKRGFERFKEPQTVKSPISSIDQVFDSQIKKIFEDYKNPSEQYKYVELSDQDLTQMEKVLNEVKAQAKKGDSKSVEKFNKMEKVFERFFVENNAFTKLLENTEQTNKDRIIALQKTMQAALFVVDQEATVVVGESNLSVFQKLANTIIEKISLKGIRKSIYDSNEKVLKSIGDFRKQKLANDETLTQIISADISKQIENQKPLTPFSLVPTQVPISSVDEVFAGMKIEELKVIQNALLETFKESLFSDSNRWAWTYSNPIEILQNPPPKGKIKNTFGRSVDDALKSAYEILEAREEQQRQRNAGDIYFSNNEPVNLYRKTYDFLEKVSKKVPKDYKTLYQNFREFYAKEGFDVSDYKDKRQGMKVYDIKDPESDFLTIPTYIKIIDQRLEQSQNSWSYKANLVQFNPEQVDIFSDQTIFSIVNKVKDQTSRDANLANNLYHQFLPVFLQSFLTLEEIFPSQADNIREQQMRFVNQLPAAKLVKEKINNVLKDNKNRLQKLQDWIEEEVLKNKKDLLGDSDAITKLLIKLQEKGKTFLRDVSYYAIESMAITGAFLAACVKLGVFTEAGFRGMLPLLGCCIMIGIAGTFTFENFAKPFIKNLLNTALHYFQSTLQGSLDYLPLSMQNFFNTYFSGITGNYAQAAPSIFLMDLLAKSLRLEQDTLGKFDNAKHELLYGLFLQEMFEVLHNLQNDLTTFPQRLAALTPNFKEHGNFSVMALNMWHMQNKDIFRLVPNELLKLARHPEFPQAVEEYFNKINEFIEILGRDFQGTREDKVLDNEENRYFFYLKQKLDQSRHFVTFELDSAYSKVLATGRPSKESTPKKETVPILEAFIKMELISGSVAKQNIETLFATSKELLKERPFFEDNFRQTIVNYQLASQAVSLNEDQKTRATELLISSFAFAKQGFSLAELWQNPQASQYKKFIQASNESSQTILSSSLFQTSLSILTKAAQVAKASGLMQGQELLEKIDTLREYQSTFLKEGRFEKNSFANMSEMTALLKEVIQYGIDQNPVVFFPAIAELETFPETEILIAIYSSFKEGLGEDSKDVFPLLNLNRTLYLTNGASDLYFLSPETRSFAMSPFTFNAIQKLLKNNVENDLSKHLGNFSQAYVEATNMQRSIPKWLPFSKKLRGLRKNQVPAIQGGQIGAPRMIKDNESYIGSDIAPKMLQPGQSSPMIEPPQEQQQAYPNQVMHNQGQMLPQGLQNPMQAAQAQNMQNQANPQGQMAPAIQQQRQASLPPDQQNMMMPMMIMPGMEQENQEMQVQAQVPEAQVAESESPLLVGVGADGRSQLVSGGLNAQENNENFVRENLQNNPLPIPVRQPNQLPEANEPYMNPAQQNFNMQVPQLPQGLGRNLVMGGGALLGAAALAYGVSQMGSTEKKKGKR